MAAMEATEEPSANLSHDVTGSPATEEPATTLPTGKTPEEPFTVKRVDLFGNVTDTEQTEAELNGWKPTQARLL